MFKFNNQFLNVCLLFILSSLWALHFSLVKLVDADQNPFSILIPLLLILCILFFCILKFFNKLFKFTYRKSFFFIVAGTFAYVVPLSVEFLVAPKIDAGILTLIVSSVPVFTLLIVWQFRLLNVNLRLILGTLSGLIGISLIVLGNINNSLNLWLIVSIIVPLSYAFNAVFMEKYWPSNLNSLQMAFGECLTSFIFVLFLNFLIKGHLTNSIIEYAEWLFMPIFWILTFVTFLEVSLYFFLLNRIGAVFINIGSYLVMPAGFLWGFVIFGELFTLLKFICTLLIINAIFLIGSQKYKINNTPIE